MKGPRETHEAALAARNETAAALESKARAIGNGRLFAALAAIALLAAIAFTSLPKNAWMGVVALVGGLGVGEIALGPEALDGETFRLKHALLPGRDPLHRRNELGKLLHLVGVEIKLLAHRAEFFRHRGHAAFGFILRDGLGHVE